jgi:Domain of unknown function (DUF4922)
MITKAECQGARLFELARAMSERFLQDRFDDCARGGLEQALGASHEFHVANGFIQDELKESRRVRLPCPERNGVPFLAQYNPARERRFSGAGRRSPPRGIEPVHCGCPICNYDWQSRGTEFALKHNLSGIPFLALPNPFPFGELHFTHATLYPSLQTWHADCQTTTLAKLRRTATMVLGLAKELPGRMILYNDESCGASIPEHFHLHSIRRPGGLQEWPLELASRHARLRCPGSLRVMVEDYPIAAASWQGTTDAVLMDVSKWLGEWFEASGHLPALRLNLIATASPRREGGVEFYAVPRDCNYPYAALMRGAIGALEVLGEFVFSMPAEGEMLANGQICHATASQILASVEPSGQREILRSLSRTGPVPAKSGTPEMIAV